MDNLTTNESNACDKLPSKESEVGFLQCFNDDMDDAFPKCGKWMLFLEHNIVDQVWEKVKHLVKTSQVFAATCSTAKNCKLTGRSMHYLGIFTCNYEHIDDVIKTLDIIESNGLIPRTQHVINYKAVKKSGPGDFKLFGIGSSMYSSDTIRKGIKHKIDNYNYLFFADAESRQIHNHCDLRPTDTLTGPSKYLLARNDFYDKGGKFAYHTKQIEKENMGVIQFTIALRRSNIIWNKIKDAILKGYLWAVKIEFMNKTSNRYRVLVYIPNFKDIDYTVSVVDNLEVLQIKGYKQRFGYTKHLQLKDNSLMNSYILRASAYNKMNRYTLFDKYSFVYYINKKQIISDGSAMPTEVLSSENVWLHAKNNKYAWETVIQQKVGCWQIILTEQQIDTAWVTIKDGIKNARIWQVTITLTSDFKYMVLLYTKNAFDKPDVLHVLKYIQKSILKSSDTVIYYNLKHPVSITAIDVFPKQPLYTSNTVTIKMKKTPCLKESKRRKAKITDDFVE